MITVDTIGRVRRAYFVQGRKIKAIARELKLARNTVRDIVRAGAGSEATERRYERKEQPLPQLGEHVAALDAMLAANAKVSKRERLTYRRLYEELWPTATRADMMPFAAMPGPGRNARASVQQLRSCR